VDDLTRERFGRAVPYHERHRRPLVHPAAPVDVPQADRHRIALCGTADLTVPERYAPERWMVRQAQLVAALRRYSR
jgi:hypothetical protein